MEVIYFCLMVVAGGYNAKFLTPSIVGALGLVAVGANDASAAAVFGGWIIGCILAALRA